MVDWQKKREELEKLAKPLIKWINDNMDPHAAIIIDCDSAVVYSGEMSVRTDEYIRD